MEDNKSKFGTLIQVRKPMLLQKNIANYLQMGRSSIKVVINDPSKPVPAKTASESCCDVIFPCCRKQSGRVN